MKSLKINLLAMLFITICFALTLPSFAYSPTITTDQAGRAADNYVRYFISAKGAWGESLSPVLQPFRVIADGADTLAYYFEVSPQGYILCNAFRQLAPIKAYSTSHALSFEGEHSFGAILKKVLKYQIQTLETCQNNPLLYSAQGIDAAEVQTQETLWETYALDYEKFKEKAKMFLTDDFGPMVQTHWHQEDPYYRWCPVGQYGICYVGCVATAAAQIMNYHNWPLSGMGSHSYLWQGEGPIEPRVLTADFSDSYDWANMLDSYTSSATQAQTNAVAELSYEIGVAFEMEYHSDPNVGSIATPSDAIDVFQTYFRYSSEIDGETRSAYPTAMGWFQMLQGDLNANRPIYYSFWEETPTEWGHSTLCDGWRVNGNLNQIHINWGWGGENDDWYTIDGITSLPLQDYAVRHIHPAGTNISGNVSGTWTLSNSPYNVTGEINIPSNQSLTIEPGVQVIFQGHYKFIVNSNATLTAVGTEQDTIHFTSSNPTTGWSGIRFLSSNYYSQLKYCSFRYGKATGSGEDQKGGAIYCNSFSPSIQNTFIQNCYSSQEGGGIYILSSNIAPLIKNCTIKKCTSDAGEGGGIFCNATLSGLTIQNCQIDSNNSDLAGGGVWCTGPNTIIENNIFRKNIVTGGNYTSCKGGGLYCNGANSLIKNNLLFNNSMSAPNSNFSGAGFYSAGVNTEIQNNTVLGNTTGGGIYIAATATGSSVINCIVWGNTSSQINANGSIVNYTDVQGGFTGTGNINADPLFVSNSFYLSQTASGQPFQSPCVNSGDPTSTMILGTTRTDGVQDAGIIDMGYHYNYGGTMPSQVVITMVPVNPPIVIPAAGGSFQYNFTLHNYTTSSQTFGFWCSAQVPGGAQFTTLGPVTLTLGAGVNLTRVRSQSVPASAPAGSYNYWGFVGTYPWTITCADNFQFTKSGTNSDWLGSEGWVCFGDPFPGDETAPNDEIHNSSFITHNSRPNPFNPSTAISFELRAASYVSLRVYDTAGRLVETLVDGYRAAGEHEVTFDGSALPSGVYLYRLEAGEYHTAGKLVLLK